MTGFRGEAQHLEPMVDVCMPPVGALVDILEVLVWRLLPLPDGSLLALLLENARSFKSTASFRNFSCDQVSVRRCIDASFQDAVPHLNGHMSKAKQQDGVSEAFTNPRALYLLITAAALQARCTRILEAFVRSCLGSDRRLGDRRSVSDLPIHFGMLCTSRE